MNAPDEGEPEEGELYEALPIEAVTDLRLLIGHLGGVGRMLCDRIEEAVVLIDDDEDPISELLSDALEDAAARLGEVAL